MIDPDVAANELERLAVRLINSFEDGTFHHRIAEWCTPDFRWENSGLPTIVGADGFRELAAGGGIRQYIPILATMSSFSVDLISIASRGDEHEGLVFTERIDHHWDPDGRDLMTPHICGIIEVRDGLVTRLADFYDVICYQQEPTGPDRRHATAGGQADR